MTGEGESGRRRRRRRSAVTMEMGMVRGKKVRMVERRSMMVGGIWCLWGIRRCRNEKKRKRKKKNLNYWDMSFVFFGGYGSLSYVHMYTYKIITFER